MARSQTNRQVEAINKTIKHTLKAKLDKTKGDWIDKLPEVLWAYRTKTKTSTRETPFLLAYGYEAIIPVEVGVDSLRRETFNEEDNEAFMRLRLDLIEEYRSKTPKNGLLSTAGQKIF